MSALTREQCKNMWNTPIIKYPTADVELTAALTNSPDLHSSIIANSTLVRDKSNEFGLACLSLNSTRLRVLSYVSFCELPRRADIGQYASRRCDLKNPADMPILADRYIGRRYKVRSATILMDFIVIGSVGFIEVWRGHQPGHPSDVEVPYGRADLRQRCMHH